MNSRDILISSVDFHYFCSVKLPPNLFSIVNAIIIELFSVGILWMLQNRESALGCKIRLWVSPVASCSFCFYISGSPSFTETRKATSSSFKCGQLKVYSRLTIATSHVPSISRVAGRRSFYEFGLLLG